MSCHIIHVSLFPSFHAIGRMQYGKAYTLIHDIERLERKGGKEEAWSIRRVCVCVSVCVYSEKALCVCLLRADVLPRSLVWRERNE